MAVVSLAPAFLSNSMDNPSPSNLYPNFEDHLYICPRDGPPRPRRPSTKAGSKYVAIQPKPLPSLASDKRLSSRPCRVKLCVQPSCNLRTHKQYAKPRNSKHKSTRDIDVDTEERKYQPWAKRAETIPEVQQMLRLSRTASRVDALPTLPLGDIGSHSALQELFHFFFTCDYDRIYRLLLPPPFTKQQKLAHKESKRIAIAKALSDPVYCLHYAACAQLQITSGRTSISNDRTSALLHGKLITLLRQKLNNFSEDEIADVLTVIFTLVMFDIATDRRRAFHFHRQATEHLFKRFGGIHNVQRCLAILLNLDRTLSIFTGLSPLSPLPTILLVRKPTTVPLVYGGSINDSSFQRLLGPEVAQYGTDVCRAIEILEWEGWSFNPADPPIPDSRNAHYFWYFRDYLLNEFVRLNVQTYHDKTVMRCALLTMKIVEYTALMDCYLFAMPHGIANRVHDAMCARDSGIDWQSHRAILCWILFVLASMTHPWSNRPWALRLLKEHLNLKYSADGWPLAWRQYELDNLHQFVWTDSRLNNNFARTCHDLQHASDGTSESAPYSIE